MKHKTALVSALSIAGVLLAGMTALAANLGILESTAGVGELSAVSEPTSTTISAADLGTTASTAEEDLVAYRINDVGVVTLGRNGDELTLRTAEVGSWEYELLGEGRHLTMRFRLDGREVNLEALVETGRTVVDVWEEQNSAPVAGDDGDGDAEGRDDDD